MGSDVKRYDYCADINGHEHWISASDCIEDELGTFVLYSNYAALEQKLEAAEQQLSEAREALYIGAARWRRDPSEWQPAAPTIEMIVESWMEAAKQKLALTTQPPVEEEFDFSVDADDKRQMEFSRQQEALGNLRTAQPPEQETK